MKFKRNEKSASISRILCVEDDFDSCSLLEFMLQHVDDGYRVICAQTTATAMRLIENQRFDLYILDYWLPETSGIELCQKIRETDSRTPIMFFTAMARPIDRAAAMAAGANEYLIKPDDLARLTGTVKRLLKKRGANSEPNRRENESNFALDWQTIVTTKDTLW